MIQRIQSIYLAFALVATLLVLMIPLAYFTDATGIQYKYDHAGLWQKESFGWLQLRSTFLITITGILAILAILASIFSFKKRMLQIKIAWGSIVLLVGLGVEIFLNTRNAASKYNLIYDSLPWTQILPWLSIIAIVLAIKNIQKDENLVKSADRLR
jgi:hypothetical protein